MTKKTKAIVWIGIVVPVATISVVVWFIVTEPMWCCASIVAPPAIDPSRLERHTRILSEELVPRDWRHPENLDRIAAYVSDEFRDAGATVGAQPYQMEGVTYRNAIGLFGPESEARIVVGAHYDALGELPGADDNASGVAGLIELAHLLDA